jgi:hypothetical protein
VLAQLLVGVASPIGEEQMIARADRLDFGDEAVEVRRPVNERLCLIALAPGRQIRIRITALLCRERSPSLSFVIRATTIAKVATAGSFMR